MLHQYVLPRCEIEDLIRELSFSYPKCFFTAPYQKRPLKKNIMVDLEKDSMNETLNHDRLNAVLAFYMRDWYYEGKLQAGAKRIDLDGNEFGTVTETEAREARERVRLAKEERALKKEEERKTFTVVNLPRQLTTPPQRSSVTTPMPTTTPEPMATIPEPMAQLCKLMGNIERISTSTDDGVLRDALIVAAIQVLITEATRFVESLKPTTLKDASEK
jgi:ProP effector